MSTGAESCTPDEMVRRLDEAVKAANRLVHEESLRDDKHRGMGTTATLAGLLGGHVYVAQVGDSRAYLARAGTIGRLTRDQSLVQDMVDMGILTEEEAERTPSNQILQAVGVASSVNPAHTYHELCRGDVLLLCSDGLSRVVSDAEIQHAASTTVDCSELCDQLVALANTRGGPDNITVLVARIEGDGLREAGTDDIVDRQPYALTPR
jgi:protein phosphatase